MSDNRIRAQALGGVVLGGICAWGVAMYFGLGSTWQQVATLAGCIGGWTVSLGLAIRSTIRERS